jgi:hypothetical protein
MAAKMASKFGTSEVGPDGRKICYTQTGFCGIGNHEGSKNKTANGAVLRACVIGGRTDAGKVGIIVCICDCHDMAREMEAMSGVQIPPVLVNRTPPRLGSLLGLAPRTTGGTGTSGTGDVGRPSVVLPSGARFVATPTGRAAKGQLEEQVRHFVSVQVSAAGDEMIAMLGLQPGTIAKGINVDSPPSTGAVYSVLKRWEAAAMVELRDGPFAFVRFTERGKRELFRAS